jgi:DNA-directed RNA polymerase subunit RPC12/RpoP
VQNVAKSLTGACSLSVMEKELRKAGAEIPERSVKRQVTCRRCGSTDVSRSKTALSFLTSFFDPKGQKRFRCRDCGFVFHSFARRKDDRTLND